MLCHHDKVLSSPSASIDPQLVRGPPQLSQLSSLLLMYRKPFQHFFFLSPATFIYVQHYYNISKLLFRYFNCLFIKCTPLNVSFQWQYLSFTCVRMSSALVCFLTVDSPTCLKGYKVKNKFIPLSSLRITSPSPACWHECSKYLN